MLAPGKPEVTAEEMLDSCAHYLRRKRWFRIPWDEARLCIILEDREGLWEVPLRTDNIFYRFIAAKLDNFSWLKHIRWANLNKVYIYNIDNYDHDYKVFEGTVVAEAHDGGYLLNVDYADFTTDDLPRLIDLLSHHCLIMPELHDDLAWLKKRYQRRIQSYR